jgi:hypothetical protein
MREYGDALLGVFEGVASDLTITNTRLEQSGRAGSANFGANVSLSSNVFECNDIDLNGEPYQGQEFDFVDDGGNSCGCAGSEDACAVRSVNLTPPRAPETQ